MLVEQTIHKVSLNHTEKEDSGNKISHLLYAMYPDGFYLKKKAVHTLSSH